MTSPAWSPEQEAKLTEALDVARRLEQQSQQMSERATQISDKYHQYRHEAALTAQQDLGNS